MEKKLTTPKLRCLIVDDEETAQYALIQLIKTVPWLSLEARCYSAVEAIDVIACGKFEIIFLDVQMPGLSGMELLSLLSPPKPQIIVTTAFREYAYEGFLHQVCHFLLKPIHPLPFMQAVLKARENIDRSMAIKVLYQQPQHIELDPFASTDQQPAEPEMMWVKSSSEQYPVRFKDIFSVTGLKDYVTITYVHGMVVAYGSVGTTLAKLPKDQFVRINRSDIVNKHAVLKINGNQVVLTNGSIFQIPEYKSREAVLRRLTS